MVIFRSANGLLIVCSSLEPATGPRRPGRME
jgi:hypothetical protein